MSGGGKLPYMQFFTGDWMKDPALRSVSLQARGLWIDVLCLMWEAHRRGYLCHRTGLPVTSLQLARMVGSTEGEVDGLVQELMDCGVCSRSEDGVLYSRRMERDEQVRQTNVNNGKRGGNPTLGKNPDNPKANPPVKGGVNRKSKAHIQSSESDKYPPTPQGGNAGIRSGEPKCEDFGDADVVNLLFASWDGIPQTDDNRLRFHALAMMATRKDAPQAWFSSRVRLKPADWWQFTDADLQAASERIRKLNSGGDVLPEVLELGAALAAGGPDP